MAWLSDHYQILSLIVSTLTLLVWVFYAHLLLNNYRRQRRPKVLINQSVRRGLSSRCLICNMSEEAIYIMLVIAELRTPDGDWDCDITDLAPDSDPGASILDQTTQGPLKAGDYRDLGDFRTMINRVLRAHGVPELESEARADVELRQLVIYLVGIYGSEDNPVGASREFNLRCRQGRYELSPTRVDTDRLSQPRQRKKVKEWLRRYL